MRKVLSGLSALLGLVVCAANLKAQGSFVYTNNDTDGANTITAYQADPSGALIQIAGSPFSTGGNGAGGGFFAVGRIIVANVGGTSYLYASNSGSNTISVFTIDPGAGSLTPIDGSPFAAGGSPGNGIALAAAGNCLFAGSGDETSSSLRTFAVNDDGSLTFVGLAIPLGPGFDALKVTSNRLFLYAILFSLGAHGSVAGFSVDPGTCALTSIPGSPFALRPAGGRDGNAAGLDINCAGTTLFVGEGQPLGGGTMVDVFSIDPASGALAPIDGSPFIFASGSNSNVPLLSPNDTLLWVSNQASNTITMLAVDSTGALSLVGPPVLAGNGVFPSGMATDQAGANLYVSKFNPSAVAGFSIAGDGTLTSLGSPFPTGQSLGMLSLTAFPGKACAPPQ